MRPSWKLMLVKAGLSPPQKNTQCLRIFFFQTEEKHLGPGPWIWFSRCFLLRAHLHNLRSCKANRSTEMSHSLASFQLDPLIYFKHLNYRDDSKSSGVSAPWLQQILNWHFVREHSWKINLPGACWEMSHMANCYPCKFLSHRVLEHGPGNNL